MLSRQLNSFLPHVYDGVVEIDAIVNSEDVLISEARSEMTAAFYNTFVLTADEYGISMFESMLDILSNPSKEDLEFRRQRLLNRLSMSPPFTFRFLKQKLDETVGKDAWDAYIDFDKYTIYVESAAYDQNWYSEIEFTINRIKPCNMVFINVPRTNANMLLSEVVSYSTLNWMYQLGSWRLGENPFALMKEGGVMKMADTKSIKPVLLQGTASFVNEEISYVIINDSIIVREFDTKKVSDNVALVQYAVTPEMTNLMTNIKLMNAQDEVLTESNVYVPVSSTVISKHTIAVKEGT